MRKKRTEIQRVPKTFRRSALCMSMLIIQTYILAFVSVYVQYTDPSRMYTTRSDASSGVVSRQQGINDTYDMLLTLAKVCVSIHQSMCICTYPCTYMCKLLQLSSCSSLDTYILFFISSLYKNYIIIPFQSTILIHTYVHRKLYKYLRMSTRHFLNLFNVCFHSNVEEILRRQ